MHSLLRKSQQFALPGSPSLNRGQFGSVFRSASEDFSSALWNTLKFLGALPLFLALLLCNLLARTALIVIPLFFLPVLLFVPVLAISALVMATGFVLSL